MKTKKPEINIKKYDLILLILITCVLIGAVSLWIQKKSIPKNTLRTTASKTIQYNVSQMKMSIYIPSKMKVEGLHNEILLKNDTGSIRVARIATSVDSALKHFELLAERNQLTGFEKTEISINGYDSLLVEFNQPEVTSRAYYIYIDHFIYSIDTNASELYAQLDAIADSFRYNQ